MVNSRVSHRWTLAQQPKGMPKLEDFKIIEEVLPELKEGEILAKAEWLTVDPYMRGRLDALKLGETITGSQVARVVESRNKDYPEGTQVVGQFGWRDLTLYEPPTSFDPLSIHKIIDMKGLPDSYALGALGMPGNTAYFGTLRVCEPKAGEVFVVSAAAGAVGSLAGQIGKIIGCKVLGFAGSDEKLEWMKDELGFDHAFNYKKVDPSAVFKEYAPEGIGSYFENVGGEFTVHVMKNMKPKGRIGVCGAISVYNREDRGPPSVPFDYTAMIYKSIRMEGFIVWSYRDEWFEGLTQMRDWILEGKLKVRETVSHGFQTMPQAFIDLLEGKNIGKQIIKA